MSENMGYLLLMYGIFVFAVFLATIKDLHNVACTPKQIYEINNLNMFACVLLFLVLVVLNPLFCVVRFLYWIFHIGREED